MAQSSDQQRVQEKIAEVCDGIKDLLIKKNSAYGNSALDPQRIFAANLSPQEQISVRVDDKLSRIKNLSLNPGTKENDESLDDTKRDLIGYLILERVAKELEDE